MNGISDGARRWHELFGIKAPVACTAGTHLFQEGAIATNIYVINSGLVKLSCTLPNGGRTIFALRSSGDYAGTIATSTGTLHAFTATAVVDSAIIKISLQELRSTMGQNVAAADFIIARLEEQLQSAARDLVDQKTLTAPQIVDKLFHGFEHTDAVASKRVGRGIRFALSDIEMAELVGISPEHFSRIKRHMVENRRTSPAP